ncbi:MAG: DsbA family protein [Dongiaceae bacterium]
MRKVWIGVAAVAAIMVAAAIGYQFLTPPAIEPAVETSPPAAPTQAGLPEIHADDKILGSPEAPVTMIEYASLTCPHCASFHMISLPRIKSEFIDKGLVRLVYRDFPLDQVALRAALLARCAPDERYFSLLDVLFRTQSDWAESTDPAGALAQIGRTAGMSQATIDGCMTDQARVDRIAVGYQEAQAGFDVRSTPTFIINGEKHSGALAFEDVEKIVKGLAPKS